MEQSVEVAVPRISKDIVEAIQCVLHARSHQRIVDQIAVFQEQSLEVIKVTSTERESGRILEQIVDVPVPQVMKGIVEIMRFFPS